METDSIGNVYRECEQARVFEIAQADSSPFWAVVLSTSVDICRHPWWLDMAWYKQRKRMGFMGSQDMTRSRNQRMQPEAEATRSNDVLSWHILHNPQEKTHRYMMIHVTANFSHDLSRLHMTSTMILQGMRAAQWSPAACDPCTLNKGACLKSDEHSTVRMWATFIATKRLWCSPMSATKINQAYGRWTKKGLDWNGLNSISLFKLGKTFSILRWKSKLGTAPTALRLTPSIVIHTSSRYIQIYPDHPYTTDINWWWNDAKGTSFRSGDASHSPVTVSNQWHRCSRRRDGGLQCICWIYP